AFPLGPLISTESGFTAMLTPLGTLTGSRPIRDIDPPSPIEFLNRPEPSPDGAENLAADVALTRTTVRQDALRSRENVDAETAAHLGRVGGADVDQQARTAHAVEARDTR